PAGRAAQAQEPLLLECATARGRQCGRHRPRLAGRMGSPGRTPGDCRWPVPEPSGRIRVGPDRSGVRPAGRAVAGRPGRTGRRPRRRVRLPVGGTARALPGDRRAGSVRGGPPRAGPGAAQPGGVRVEGGDWLPLARRDHRVAGAVRRHRDQPAVPYPGQCQPARHRPALHRRRRRCTQAGWAPVAGRQPAPAVRVGAGRERRADAGGRRAGRLQDHRGGEGPSGASPAAASPRTRGLAMKLVRLLANLGYGSRKQVALMFREGRVTDAEGEVLYADDQVTHDAVRIDGEPLDPPSGLVLMLHKPVGHTCSTRDPGRIVYDLLPPRFRLRSPLLSTVGRLDRDTSGLLLMTDDGQRLHRIVSPRANLAKVYEATLAQDLRGDEGAVFASGTLMLENEKTPLAPASLEVVDPRHA